MRETRKLTTGRSSESPRESLLVRSLRPAIYGVAGAVVGASLTLTATTMAQQGRPPVNVPAPAWKSLEAQGKQMVALFGIDVDGTFRPYITAGATVEPYDPNMQADHTVGMTVKVSNPRTCWTTTTGDEKCVTY